MQGRTISLLFYELSGRPRGMSANQFQPHIPLCSSTHDTMQKKPHQFLLEKANVQNSNSDQTRKFSLTEEEAGLVSEGCVHTADLNAQFQSLFSSFGLLLIFFAHLFTL